jgi:hypothetical protein
MNVETNTAVAPVAAPTQSNIPVVPTTAVVPPSRPGKNRPAKASKKPVAPAPAAPVTVKA